MNRTTPRLPKTRLLLAGAALLAIGAAPAPTAPTADLILTNARIYTVETGQPWAEAVAIKDGKILAVGSAADVARRKGTATRVVDLGGRFVMPAFGDAHAHPIFGGMSHARCSLHAGKTLDDYRRIIADCVAKTPGTGTIFGSGWNQSLFPPKGIPNKELLDSVSKDRALIFESDGHTLWVNSKALELAKITRDTPDPKNGTIDRDASGEPVGALEESAMALVEPLVPPPTAKDLEGAITYTVTLFNSLGITSWHDASVEWDKGGTSKALDAYKAVKDRGALTAHTVMDLHWNNDRGLDQMPDIVKLSARAREIGLTANGVKFFIDGVIPQQTAAMLAPYEGTDVKGATQITPDALAAAVAQLDARNMQSHFHAIGDAGVRQALDAVESARRSGGAHDTRPMISHMNVIDPADQPRFGKLDVTAIFQPLWACNEAYMDLAIERIGPKRATYIYPSGSVLRFGGRLAYGADWSVASANPMEGIEVALTRVAPEGDRPPLGAGERITLAQALRAYTLNVAYVNHLDKQTGSLAPGKSADIIVLDRNLFETPVRQIHSTKVLLTLFQGREVFGKLQPLGR
ncbi:amidohydrolase [Sphingomonas psychrotolerans]|uniref:Amidohydrolase n=1 Tax=Sphingomonas psychrotolerans TaxID=1327635 RepID=A0A2K8MJH6_9SPHN|nr:amidohydrolase [Sphingomonas psychrotolerans]ATY34013.1 amidohydrolase [Sphingomonas psychrotolerans]